MNDVDDRYSKRGCEGVPEPVLLRMPIGGGTRQALGQADGDALKGHFLRTSDGRVAVVEECEEHLRRIFIAQESPEGWLRQVAQVPKNQRQWPDVAEIVAWSSSPTHLLAATVTATNRDGEATEFAVVRIDRADGTVEELFRVPYTVAQVGQFPDGRIVSAGDGKVRLHSEHGQTTREVAGDRFAIGSDGSLAVYGEGLTVIPPRRPPRRPATCPPRRRPAPIGEIRWSPDGEALAYLRRSQNGGSVGVVTLDGTVTNLSAEPR